MNFQDQNPYESPVIVAELADTVPARKPVKRRPLLAAVLLLFNAPLSLALGLFWLGVVASAIAGMPANDEPYNPIGLFIFLIFSLLWWLAGIICLKEIVQAARGR